MTPESSARSLPVTRRSFSQVRLDLDGAHGLYSVAWRPGLLEQIRAFALEAYEKGVEMGGVFYGRRVQDALEITAWKPFLRSAAATDTFSLNNIERRYLARLLRPETQRSVPAHQVPLGWFRTICRNGPPLEAQDLELHERFFPTPWQFILSIRPARQKPTVATLFLRNEANDVELRRPSAVFPLQPGPVDSSQIFHPDSLPEVKIAHGLREGARLVMPLRHWLLYACASLLLLAFSIAYLQIDASLPGPELDLKVSSAPEGLRIRWNPNGLTPEEAASSYLLVAGERVNFSADEFLRGEYVYALHPSDRRDLEVRIASQSRQEVTHWVQSARNRSIPRNK